MRRYYQVLSVDDSKNLYNVLIYKIFFSYIKDQTIYQLGIIKNKEELQQRLVKSTKIFLKKKNKKNNNMVAKDIKILVEYRNFFEYRKTFHNNFQV